MSEAPEKKDISPVSKAVWFCAYGSVLIFYGVAGGVALGLLLPDVPIWFLMIASGFVGAKLDYKFKGPASKLEQRYVSMTGK